MSDYVSRGDVLNALCGECKNYNLCFFSEDEIPVCPVFWKMQNIPGADVVEIEPGAWILTDFDGNTMKIKGIQRERIEEENEVERKKGAWLPLFPIACDRPYCYECSCCGSTTGRMTNFCQNCGADMRQGGDT